MLPLSICLIGKNEEKYVKECLSALKPLTDAGAELVFTDTGSTDSTLEIVTTFTDKLYHFKWCDDFSAARNYCANMAGHSWILFVDCDEILSSGDSSSQKQFSHVIETIHNFINNNQSTNEPVSVGMIELTSPTIQGGETIDWLARLYHKDYYEYRGIIHEQLFAKSDHAVKFTRLPLSFSHKGYSDTNILPQKAKRNLNLLRKAYQNNPQDTYTLFQLGQTYRILKDYTNALFYFEKALELDVNPKLNYVQTMIESYGYTLLELGQKEKAYDLYGVYDTFCNRADFVFLMGLISMNNGLFEQAVNEFTKATSFSECSTVGVNDYLANYNIGVIYECLGKHSKAIKYYKLCKDYGPAITRLSAITPN